MENNEGQKRRKKFAVIIAVVALVSLTAVGVTYAYLTSKSQQIVNTFTVGDVQITLAESEFNAADEHILVPGKTIDKNPTVTVLADSENCYVAFKVIVPKALDPLVTLNWDTDDWSQIAKTTDPDNSNNYAYYYNYKYEVEKDSDNTVLESIFTNVFVNLNVTNAQLKALTSDDLKISVQAYAVQSLGFDSPEKAIDWLPED